MSLIWASRNGLSEGERLDLLGEHQEPLSRAIWTPLRLALGESLSDRSGLVAFSHRAFTEAVEQRYGEPARIAAHARLADYFEPRSPSRRRDSELLWQLARAERWERLRNQLTEIPLVERFIERGRRLLPSESEGTHELLSYWRTLAGRYSMVDELERAVSIAGTNHVSAGALGALAELFWVEAKHGPAEALQRQALEAERRDFGSGSAEVARRTLQVATVVLATNRPDEAEALVREAVSTPTRRDSSCLGHSISWPCA